MQLHSFENTFKFQIGKHVDIRIIRGVLNYKIFRYYGAMRMICMKQITVYCIIKKL